VIARASEEAEMDEDRYCVMDEDRYCVNEPSVISEVVDGETIVLNFENGHYYSFNPSASAIWGCVCAGSPDASVTEWVAQRFGVDPAAIATEVADFLRSLEDERLIRRAAAGEGGGIIPQTAAAVAPGEPIAAFSAPSFDKFTDMEELLLLDPIHEVGESGWPKKP